MIKRAREFFPGPFVTHNLFYHGGEFLMSKYAGTKTEQNLLDAFAGESQARNKYTLIASSIALFFLHVSAQSFGAKLLIEK